MRHLKQTKKEIVQYSFRAGRGRRREEKKREEEERREKKVDEQNRSRSLWAGPDELRRLDARLDVITFTMRSDLVLFASRGECFLGVKTYLTSNSDVLKLN